MNPLTHSKILVIGNDPALTYLIVRYAQRGGYDITSAAKMPPPVEARALHPTAIIFQSVAELEAAHPIMADLANDDLSILVCSSVADEARARELGADHCLLHPLTYDCMLAALT